MSDLTGSHCIDFHVSIGGLCHDVVIVQVQCDFPNSQLSGGWQFAQRERGEQDGLKSAEKDKIPPAQTQCLLAAFSASSAVCSR